MYSPAPQLAGPAPGFFEIPFLVVVMLYQRFSYLAPFSPRVHTPSRRISSGGGRDAFNEPTGPSGEHLGAEGRPCKYLFRVQDGVVAGPRHASTARPLVTPARPVVRTIPGAVMVWPTKQSSVRKAVFHVLLHPDLADVACTAEQLAGVLTSFLSEASKTHVVTGDHIKNAFRDGAGDEFSLQIAEH
ncbi:hypothetical protein THAOC_06387 [Thalassiosira oceanica]|uniref:Uncharacterized protein n=1 Tax=Thalassiosira oceanica TaxID=159749 RepID=K0T4Q6_THAOC|nr:hypothetical protein THAOC_06387 [Thalassiosira oceanica]|eukprot:EJK72114.1 hypothetical protein THAOC_06387 [Thalassiosira oceanica]